MLVTRKARLQDLAKEAQKATGVGLRPPPKFHAGQSVLQWWSSKFRLATDKTVQLRCTGKGRPSWYSGEVTMPGVWADDVVYASMPFTGWVYAVH